MKDVSGKSIPVFIKILFTSGVLYFLTACDHEVSEEIATNDMYFYVHAVADIKTDVLTVTVNIRDSDKLFADHVKLTSAESIQAIFNNESKALLYRSGFYDPLLGSFKYRVRFDAGVTSGQNSLTVKLNRADGSVISTEVVIPDPFAMTSPLDNSRYYFADNDSIITNWEVGIAPENDRVSYLYSCRYENSKEWYISYITETSFAVAGSDVFSVDDILASISNRAYSSDNTTCYVTVKVRNLLYDQTVNQDYAGGSTRSTMQNSRDVQVISLP